MLCGSSVSTRHGPGPFLLVIQFNLGNVSYLIPVPLPASPTTTTQQHGDAAEGRTAVVLVLHATARCYQRLHCRLCGCSQPRHCSCYKNMYLLETTSPPPFQETTEWAGKKIRGTALALALEVFLWVCSRGWLALEPEEAHVQYTQDARPP